MHFPGEQVKNNNTNFLGKDGFIYNVYAGDQTITSLKKACQELLAIITSLQQRQKPILVLTDIRNLGKLNLSARRYAVEVVKTLDFDKVAIFGNPTALRNIVNTIIAASGRGFKMKYFDNADEAKKWLLT